MEQPFWKLVEECLENYLSLFLQKKLLESFHTLVNPLYEHMFINEKIDRIFN